MKYVYLGLLFLAQQAFGSEFLKPELLKGVKAITVSSQISPRSLDQVYESALVNTLSKSSKVIKVDYPANGNFYTAISNSTFLKLSLQNWITETGNTEKKQFKVEMQIVLECSTNPKEKNGERNLLTWIGEESFDFLPNEQKLMEIGKKAVVKLTNQFIQEYKLQNTDKIDQLIFYIL
jgi:hypothetical protein